jgi:hypothetical protein
MSPRKPKKEERTERFELRLTKREHELLTILADEEGRSRANYLRWLIKVMYKRRTAE